MTFHANTENYTPDHKFIDKNVVFALYQYVKTLL